MYYFIFFIINIFRNLLNIKSLKNCPKLPKYLGQTLMFYDISQQKADITVLIFNHSQLI